MMARKRANTPPYVPRNGFRAVLDQIQAHGRGDVVTREDLHKRGLSSHLTYPALAALHFLGLLDGKGALTGEHGVFHRDRSDPDGIRRIVERSYAKFFEEASLPAPDYGAVKGAFQDVYELSDRLIHSSFPLFQYLAEEGGIELVSGSSAKAGRGEEPGEGVADTVSLPVSRDPAPASGNGDGGVPGAQIVLNIQVTKYTKEKDIIRMVKTAHKALHLLKKSSGR